MKESALFRQYLRIEQERNKLMLEISQQLGFDFTFTEEEMLNNAFEKYLESLTKKVMKEVI